MLDITRSGDRFHFETDWLSAYWHFSFDHYYDPKNLSFGPLRVFNNDTIQPGRGFPMHPHRDMEILTYVIRGELEHKDNTGGHGRIHAGEVQRMSAGSGIVHSEFNASQTDTCELVQIWITPAAQGVEPSYGQRRFTLEDRAGKLLSVADGNSNGDTMRIGQDATLYVSSLRPEDDIHHALASGRRAYLFVIDGKPALNGELLERGDSVKISGEGELRFEAVDGASELLLIDLP